MRLFIKVENGVPVDHPMLEENVKAAFPDVDLNNLPNWLARFERVEFPELGPYEVHERVAYEPTNDGFKDVHYVREMTEQEKVEKQNLTKAIWAENGFASWIFDADICGFKAPIPYPEDGKNYRWDEPTTSWVLS